MLHSASIQPVVVAPTFNNARTLADVLGQIDAVGLASIVVDDGCTDGTALLLQRWAADKPLRSVITHLRNRGKAAALVSGFSAARSAGFTHAITIDTDGQLDPAQIPQLLDRAVRHPRAIVVGCRDAAAADYPAVSRLGRRVSNLLIRWESGAMLDDSQCGFRVYPLELVAPLACRAGRFGFETEILTRAAWAGVAIEQIAVRCRYALPGGRVSHFRPWSDSWSACGMHLKLVAIAMLRRSRAESRRAGSSLAALPREASEQPAGAEPRGPAWALREG